jgi:hypothetical protein
MFTEEPNTWDRVFVVLLVIAVFGGLAALRMYAATRDVSTQLAESAQPPSNDLETKPVPRVQFAPSRVVRDDGIARVYECDRDGQRILSDQPCGSHAQVRIVTAPNRMDAQDTSGLYEQDSPPRRRTTSSRPTATNAALVSRCAAIEREIDVINARMRQGYTKAEGARERLRELSEERWNIECRWLKMPSSLRD